MSAVTLSPVAEENSQTSVRILIADDQALVRAGFRMILDAEQDLDVVGEATDGEEAVRAGPPLATGRRADGHPHAGARRARGDASRSSPRRAQRAGAC